MKRKMFNTNSITLSDPKNNDRLFLIVELFKNTLNEDSRIIVLGKDLKDARDNQDKVFKKDDKTASEIFFSNEKLFESRKSNVQSRYYPYRDMVITDYSSKSHIDDIPDEVVSTLSLLPKNGRFVYKSNGVYSSTETKKFFHKETFYSVLVEVKLSDKAQKEINELQETVKTLLIKSQYSLVTSETYNRILSEAITPKLDQDALINKIALWVDNEIELRI